MEPTPTAAFLGAIRGRYHLVHGQVARVLRGTPGICAAVSRFGHAGTVSPARRSVVAHICHQACPEARELLLPAVMEPKHPQVVVAYDFSANARAVLDRAVALVTRAPFHALHFVTVIDPHKGVTAVPPDGKVDFRYSDQVRDLMMKELGKVLAETPVASELHFFAHARIGKPAAEILDLAKEIGADLILIGTHGHTGLQRLVMGSVAETVVREAGCPVLVARPKTYPDITLAEVHEVERSKPVHSRARFSYSDNVMKPPVHWPGV